MESAQGKGISERTLKDLFQALKVELIALAVPGSGLGEQTELQLYSAWNPIPDRRSFATSGAEGLRRILFALDAPLPVESAWSGLKLIDVYGSSHPVVLGVTAGSPAAVAGVAAGDLLVSVGASPIQKAGDLLPILRRASAGDDAVLTVETAGKIHDVRIKYLSTPVLLAMKDPEILYNKAIADLRQAAATAGDASRRAYAWMNIGVALMHFGRYEEAIRDALRKADLPEGAGISKGTVRYLTALCYEKYGLPNDARAAYLEAAASATATVESHDGPLVAPSARRRAAAISSKS
jgi:tetratricopeptide (TPR) repeat protein